jgi:LysM repeat protein
MKRTLRGLSALLALAATLAGWPAALLWLADTVAPWLPDLSDPLGLLSRPDAGGLFLLIVLALGWIAWLIWVIALLVEAVAQARGLPTPRLGGLFPQNSAAALVTAIAVAFSTTGAGAAVAAPAPVTAPVTSTVTTQAPAVQDPAAHVVAAPVSAPEQSASDDEAPAHTEYVVARGDTLWDIADEQLGDPTRYPEIVQASDDLHQPDGRHLTDPDLILPGWILHIPTDQAQEPAAAEPPAEAATADPADTSPTAGDVPSVPGLTGNDPDTGDPAPVTPPRTPMQSGEPTPPDQAAGIDLPPTPLAAGGAPTGPPGGPARAAAVYDDEGRFAPDHGVLGLPNWITGPLTPVRPEDAPEVIAEAHRILAAHSAAVRARQDPTG